MSCISDYLGRPTFLKIGNSKDDNILNFAWRYALVIDHVLFSKCTSMLYPRNSNQNVLYNGMQFFPLFSFRFFLFKD